jgi:cobalt-zinc-cadmium efflux system outer membrane protein
MVGTQGRQDMGFGQTARIGVIGLGLVLVCAQLRAGLPPAADIDSTPVVEIPVSPRLTLAGVVEQTWQRNPGLQVFQARLEQADALRTQADSVFAADPAFSLRHNNSGLGSRNGLSEWEWGLEMPIWLPGQRTARRRVAEQDRQGVAASEQALRLAIAGTVREALWQIALLRNRATLAHREWQTARQLEQDVARRVRLGDLPESDLVLAQQETLTRQDDYRSAAADLRQQFDRYRSLTGLDSIPADYKETESRQTGIGNRHPALAETMAQVDALQARLGQARHERRGNPTLTLGTRHERALSGEDYESSVGVIVRVPLGLSSQSAPGLATAGLELARAQQQRDELKRQLGIGLQQATQTLQTTRAALQLAQRQNRLAGRNLELARKSFALGESDLFTLLRIQTQAFNAEQNLQRREIELQFDIASYNQALGVLP